MGQIFPSCGQRPTTTRGPLSKVPKSQHSLLPRKVPFTSNLIPIVDMVAYWQILCEYGCTLIMKKWSLTQICSTCLIYRWKCISTYPRSTRSWHHTKDLNLGLPPRISTSWHLTNGHYSWHLTKSHISWHLTKSLPSWHLTKSIWILASHQDPQLGLSPSDFHLKWNPNLICSSP
jgi:hypothetical protein